MASIISVNQLTKRYGSSRGISDVTFEVEEGEVFGFLGPNGAGKTTTIRTLLGLLRPTSGGATIAGLDCWAQSTAVKRLVGYLPGEFTLDPALTGAQIVEYLGNLRGGVDQAYVTKLVERLELDPSRRFRQYSRGNKQKVGLVQAFMHRPRILIFDEPTSGLDPLNQQEFYHMLAEAKAEGSTALLSSHNLPEVEHTCDRVGIIREGQLVKVDTVHALTDIHHHEVELTFPAQASADWFTGVAGVRSADVNNGGHSVRLTVQGDLAAVLQVAAQHGAVNLSTREPSLEEVFLRYYTPQSTAPTGSVA
ncbi:MAG: ATP-binding cassette domain-containing protein [Ktedonobacterales bacterium]